VWSFYFLIFFHTSESGAEVCKESVCRDERTCGNTVMTFLIKKGINTETFIHRTAALYIEETRIRVVTNEGDLQVGVCWLEDRLYIAQKCHVFVKGVGMKDQVWNYLEMS